MKFTDLFIHRPVLASVISLLILVLGLRAMTSLEVRQYPETQDTVVTVTTTYPGASSELVQGFITTPLQQAIAEADGIDYLSSTSKQGISTIEAHMRLNYDPNAAVAEIQAKVSSRRNVLPSEADDPVITSQTGDRTALMYMAFYSDSMLPAQITDYLLRVVQPKLQAVEGVGKAELLGNKTFAMRIWLEPDRMAAFGLTPADIADALRANNYLSGVGMIQENYVQIDLGADTDVSTVEDFRRLIITENNDTLIRLEDIARIEMGAEDYNSTNWYKGKNAIFMGITQAPGANPLTVAQLVRAEFEKIKTQVPEGMQLVLPYDASEFIQDSIDEVIKTLAEAVLIVLVVIYLSLGSLRAALIPAVTVPLSLIGGAFLMLLMGFSLNLLTLLAMVLAIGLVVDDAIVVVENVHRHLAAGETRFNAAIQGARELGLPIISMTTTLVAVYAPIGFMGGLVGTLFTEFAFALAGAVVISGVVALTLAPMLGSRVLVEASKEGRFEHVVENFFNGLATRYQRALHSVIEYPWAVVVFSAVVMVSIYFMFILSQNELAPTEDQGILFFFAQGPQTATLDYNETYTREIVETFESVPEYKESFLILGFGDNNLVFGGFKMPPQSQRERSQMEIRPEVQGKVSQIAGFQIAMVPRPSLPGTGGGFPLQFVMTSDADYRQMDEMADALIGKAMESGKFIFLQKDLQFNRPKINLVIDRDRAGDLGISMQEIGRNLANALSGQYVNRFSLQGRSYKVIAQIEDEERMNTEALANYYLTTASGSQVPLSSLVTFEKVVEPSKRTQFQQLNSLTVQGLMPPNVTQGDAIAFLEETAAELFPRGYGWDYTGESRQYVQQGSALLITFFMSLLVIYLVLAAQFESWRDPLIILISVPLSLASALAFMMLGFASVNIYTQVGLITLIGLIAKNGILIVEFSNQLQIKEGLDKRSAVERASAIRLRPILMTTVAMVVAMVPLLTASGPGAVSRFDIGLVIATGLGIGTLFTLFVVPAFYLLLARDHHAAQLKLQAQQAQT